MTDIRNSWRSPAAYLYTLNLDEVSLAWEYLRRNSRYRNDWSDAADQTKPSAAVAWGLRYLEDPSRDARSANPPWHPLPHSSVHLKRHEDIDQFAGFEFWRIPGVKSLVHDGTGLQLTARGTAIRRAVIASDLGANQPYAFAVPAAGDIAARCRAVREFVVAYASNGPKSSAPLKRPTRSALTHMRALQALDGTLANASHREIAMAIFGIGATRDHWAADSELRAQIRYLVRRGKALAASGFRARLRADSS